MNQELINQYLDDIKLYTNSEATVRNKTQALQRFDADFDKPFTDLTDTDIKKWLKNRQELSKVSQLTYLTQLKAFFDFLIEEGVVPVNPVVKILKRLQRSNKNANNGKEVYLSIDDVKRIILSANDIRVRTMILVFYKTGLRVSELQRLDIPDIDFDRRIITIPRRKGGKSGYVVFDKECERYLKRWIAVKSGKDDALFVSWDGGRLTVPYIRRLVTDVCKKAGYPKITCHSFRHIFTTHLQANRCHVEVIRVLRGDSGGGMVSYYTHFSVEQVREEYNRTMPRLGV